jgi:hypothetical protein
MREPTYTSEACVKRQVKKLLVQHNFTFSWMPAANAFGKAGAADFLALRGSMLLAIETKFGYNKPSAAQTLFLKNVNANGGVGFVVNERLVSTLGIWLSACDRTLEGVGLPDDAQTMFHAGGALRELIR